MLIALALASVLVSDDPDGVVTTARDSTGSVLLGAEAPTTDARPEAAQVVAVTPDDLTTREQIDRWISARSPDARPFAEDVGPRDTGDDRQMHGFVSAAIGTDDFSSVAVGVSLPIGANGRLDLAYSQTKNGWGMPGYDFGAYDYPMDYGYGDPVYAARVRPYQVLGSPHVLPGRSRSVSARFSWDEDDRGERRERTRIIGAQE